MCGCLQISSFYMNQLKVFRTDRLNMAEPNGQELKFCHQAPYIQTWALILRNYVTYNNLHELIVPQCT